jgi:hypothetical protein
MPYLLHSNTSETKDFLHTTPRNCNHHVHSHVQHVLRKITKNTLVYPAGRDRWGGKRVVGGMLPRINIGADVWGESSIITGFINAGVRVLCTSDGVCVIVYV